METLGPADAVFLPLFAGLALGGLYLLIKWLEDPALLSVILNVYFSFFGVVATAKLGADAMGVLLDFVFPDSYRLGNNGRVWKVVPAQRRVETLSPDGRRTISPSPLPGLLASLPLRQSVREGLWTLRELPKQKSHVRVYVHNLVTASVKIGPVAVLSTFFAVGLALYTNFISTPWYLNNLSAFAFVYTALQVMTPSTAWTATLILGALFVYDIYFVFYTPLMVTVATKLDIPAKMLFPRPEGMSMLGLGDLAIPGMVIGFALRFDLWNFYRKQQTRQPNAEENGGTTEPAVQAASIRQSEEGKIGYLNAIKPRYQKATGHWGTRFWTTSIGKTSQQDALLGTQFPKPYFYATMAGYVIGMLCTLLIMQVYGHAQPALLYLVPGVLGGLWSTALAKHEVGVIWDFYDGSENDGEVEKTETHNQVEKDESKKKERGWWSSLIHDFFTEDREKPKTPNEQSERANGSPSKQSASTPDTKNRRTVKSSNKPAPTAWHKGQLFHLSVSFPSPPPISAKPPLQPTSRAEEQDRLDLVPSKAFEDSGKVEVEDESSTAENDEAEGSGDEASRLLDILEGRASD